MIVGTRFRAGGAVGAISALLMILGGATAYGRRGPLGDTVSADQPVPRLVRLEVDGAAHIPGTNDAYAAEYDPSGGVTVRAVVEPLGGDAGIVWHGCEASAGSPDRCLVGLDQVTKPGQPLAVTAALGATSLAIHLVIRPRLLWATVTGAERSTGEGSAAEQVWIADYDETQRVQITIVTEPDTPLAYEYLQWTGGEPGPAGNVRLVGRNVLTSAGNPIKVRVKDGSSLDFVLYVLPRIRDVELVAAPNVHDLGGGDYAVDFEPEGHFTIRALTSPDTGGAYAVLGWQAQTGSAAPVALPGGVNEEVCPAKPISPQDTPTIYTVGVVYRGALLEPLTVRVTIRRARVGESPPRPIRRRLHSVRTSQTDTGNG